MAVILGMGGLLGWCFYNVILRNYASGEIALKVGGDPEAAGVFAEEQTFAVIRAVFAEVTADDMERLADAGGIAPLRGRLALADGVDFDFVVAALEFEFAGQPFFGGRWRGENLDVFAVDEGKGQKRDLHKRVGDNPYAFLLTHVGEPHGEVVPVAGDLTVLLDSQKPVNRGADAPALGGEGGDFDVPAGIWDPDRGVGVDVHALSHYGEPGCRGRVGDPEYGQVF